MASILIIDCTEKSYHGGNHRQKAMGGIERCVVQLSNALARAGHDVSVWNNTDEAVMYESVRWIPKAGDVPPPPVDIVIACNDARFFDTYAEASGHRAFKPVLWHHNRVLVEKTIRKGRLWPLMRWRPTGVFLSRDQLDKTSRLLPYRKRVIIGHGLEPEVLAHNAPDGPREKIAVFLSQPYRGLAEMIALWRREIHPAHPDAAFHIFAEAKPGQEDGQGIFFKGRKTKEALIKHLDAARIALIPGHVDETFCLAAAEATALGIPVITYGTGALIERVIHGQNGLIAADAVDFAQKIKDMFGDESAWLSLRRGALASPTQSWDDAALSWQKLFKEIP